MPSIQLGQSSSASSPILDLFTGAGNPVALVDVAALQFRVLDVSTDAKKVAPVQVYPAGPPGTFQVVDPTTAPSSGVRLGVGHYFAPWTVPSDEAIGDHQVAWQFRLTGISPWEAFTRDFVVAPNPGAGPDPTFYCSVGDVRAEGFTDPILYPDAWVLQKINEASRFVDKATGRWFFPKEFPLVARPTRPRTTIAAPSDGASLPQGTINVASTAAFPSSGTLVVTTDAGDQAVTYASLGQGGTTFLGCRGGTGAMTTGDDVLSGIVYPAVNLLPGTPYPVPTQLNLLPGDRPMMLSGDGRRDMVTCELSVPICRLDALGIENQAFLSSQLTWIELAAVRVFNRHLRGMIQPDDRENPRLAFTVAGRIVDVVTSGLYPAPRIYPHGRMNVYLFGAFGYTDPDPAGVVAEGITPLQIRRVTKLLAIRDLLPEARRRQKIPFQNMHRIVQDREGTTSIGLAQNTVRGGITGDPEIDTILTAYRRPPRMGVS